MWVEELWVGPPTQVRGANVVHFEPTTTKAAAAARVLNWNLLVRFPVTNSVVHKRWSLRRNLCFLPNLFTKEVERNIYFTKMKMVAHFVSSRK